MPYRIERPATAIPLRESYRIQLPKVLKHNVITEANRRKLGQVLEKYFFDALIMFVKGGVCFTGNERASLRRFFELYNIDPDTFDLEAGRKQYRDYKDTILKANGQIEEVYNPENPLSLLCA